MSWRKACECIVTKVTVRTHFGWLLRSTPCILPFFFADIFTTGFCFNLSGNGCCSLTLLNSCLSSASFFALFLTYSLFPFNDISVTWPSTFALSLLAVFLSSEITVSVPNCSSASSAFFNFNSSSETSPSKSSGSFFERLRKAQSFEALKQHKSSHCQLLVMVLTKRRIKESLEQNKEEFIIFCLPQKLLESIAIFRFPSMRPVHFVSSIYTYSYLNWPTGMS